MSNKLAITGLKSMLAAPSVNEQFKNALGENANAFTASLVEMMSSNPTLQQCNPKDLVMEALKSATLKLPINKNLGLAWIIPRKEQGQMKPMFQIGYRGYIQLAIRTGKYRKINAGQVYDNWSVDIDYLTGDTKITGTSEISKNPPVGYFAYFELVNGFSKTIYWSRERVEIHRDRYVKGLNSNYSPWNTDFDKMAIKTVLTSLLSKWGFLSIEMSTAFANDFRDVQEPSEFADQNENTEDFDIKEPERKTLDPEKEIVSEPEEDNPFA